MNYSLGRFLEELLLPAAILTVTVSMALLCSVVLRYLPMSAGMIFFIKIVLTIPYFLFLAGMILGWRYRNTGILLTSLFLALIYLAVNTYGPPVFSKPVLASAICKAALFIFPLNIILVSMLTKRRIFLTTGSLYLFLFSLQLCAIALFCNPTGSFFRGFTNILYSYSSTAPKELYGMAKTITLFVNHISFSTCVVVTIWTFIFLFARFYYSRDISIAGFIGIFAATMTGLLIAKQAAVLMIYFTSTGIMLLLSAAEASFSFNTVDKLTGLPTRKLMRKEINALTGEYAVAIINIDNLSKFNDTYGSAKGDEIINIVADKLPDIAGGITAFRYGGEEFLVLLKGFNPEEAVDYLDSYRKKIESFPIFVNTQKNIQNDKYHSSAKQVQITVSIGVAISKVKKHKPDYMFSAADKALALAKQKGKNCVVLFDNNSKKTRHN